MISTKPQLNENQGNNPIIIMMMIHAARELALCQ
jgi:hypothetical protein